jgi:uncharacterized membrane protein YraQ (UPF0718 family)
MNKAVNFLKEYGIISLFGVFVVVAKGLHFTGGDHIIKSFMDFSVEMLTFIPCLFLLIGLFDVWMPKELLQQHLGEASGVKGAVMVILFAMLQGGPLYAAFPVAAILWQKGCSPRNIFIYLGAFSTLKIPMLTFEIGFLGLKFSLLRTLITLPVFLVIAEIIARYLRHTDFQINNGEAPK